MKKQTYMLFIALAILLTSLVAVSAQPNLVVTGFKIKNGTAEVGKDFTLSVELTNTISRNCAQDIMVSVQSGYPFIMRDVSSKPVADICSSDPVTVDFPMRVDPTATGGFYQVIISSTYQSVSLAELSSSGTLNLFVQGSPDITASIVNSNPIDVYPGDTARVTINVQNDGTFRAQSLKASLNAEEPLIVKWATSMSTASVLEAKSGKDMNFDIEVPKDAASKDYSMQLEVVYQDENLNEITKYIPLTFHVKEKATFETIGSQSKTLYANQNGKTIDIYLNNTGTATAYKVKAKIIPFYPFSTDGSVRYVDELKPGEKEPIKFTIDTDKDASPGTYTLDMNVDYENSLGESMHDTSTVVLTIKNRGIIATLVHYWYLVAAVAIIAVVISKKNKAKKKSK